MTPNRDDSVENPSYNPLAMSLRKNASLITFLVLLCCCIGIIMYSVFVPVVTDEKGYVYDLHPGTAKRTFAANLAQAGILKHPILFAIFAYTQPHKQLKTGEYLFPRGANLFEIWSKSRRVQD